MMSIALKTIDDPMAMTEFEIERHMDTLIVKVSDWSDRAEATIDMSEAARLHAYLTEMLATQETTP